MASALDESLFDGRDEVPGFTIDPLGSRDLDDAIYLETRGTQKIVHISIADVGAVVPIGSDEDKKAYEQASTHYLTDRIEHMLPEALAEGLVSLLEGEKRPTITISIPFDETLVPGDPIIRRTFMKSERQLTYSEAEKLINAGNELSLRDLYSIAQALSRQRKDSGALVFQNEAAGLGTTDEGLPYLLGSNDLFKSHLVIQELMILANSTLAKYFAENGIPCLFRNHKAKKSAPAREDLLSDIGLILARADSSGINNVRNKLKVILGRADYSPESSGHYALNLLYYMHFTSPVRRFGDLAVNRQLTARLKGLPLPYSHEDLVSISEHLNLSEKKNRRRKYLPEDTGSMVIPEKLYGLGDKGFSTVFGYSLWSGSITPAIEQEFLRRLDSGKLKTRDLYAALFKGELDKMAMITGPVIDHVRREPQEAVSILSMAAQLLQSEPPVYETRRLYPQSNPIYLSTASMFFKDQNYLSEPMESTSKKASQQLAAVSLLENILGIAKREKVDTGLAVKQIDYIYRLNALCSKNRWGKVNYDLIEFEPANDERLFTMNAGINLYGVYFETGPVSAVSRVQAQQEAAMRLLERIQKIPAVDKGNYINALYTLCQRMSLPAPTFEYNGMPPNISGKLRLVLPQTGEKIYDCTGRDWKQAKRAAAEIAFKESIRLLA